MNAIVKTLNNNWREREIFVTEKKIIAEEREHENI